MIKKLFQEILNYFDLNKRIKKRKKRIFDLKKAKKFSKKCDTSEKVELANYIMEEFGIKKTVNKELEKEIRANQKLIARDEDLPEKNLIHIAKLKEEVSALRFYIKARRGMIKDLQAEKEKWA